MVVLDRFSGGNPEGWIVRAELYFTYLGFSEKDWLPLPYHYLDGAALAWFDWLFRNKQFFDWNHFKEKLKLRFRTRTREEPGRCLAVHQQRKPMANLLARAAAIPSWCKINPSSSPQYWKEHSDSNNLNLAYEVFEEMSGTIRNNEAVVETSELLEKHIDVASTYNVSTGSHVEVELLKNMEILDELQASNVLVTKKEEFLDEDHVFNEMPHNCDSTVLAVVSNLEDGNSEVEKVLDGNPERTIDKNYVSPTDAATNFLVPFTSGEDIVPKVIASPSQVTHPFENVILLHIPRSPCLCNFFDKKFMMANEVSDIDRYVPDDILFVGYEKIAWDEEFALIIKQPSLCDFRLEVLSRIILNTYATLPYGSKETILMDEKLSMFGDVIMESCFAIKSDVNIESCLLSLDSSELVVSSSGARSVRLAYPFPCGGRESVAPIVEQVAGTFVLEDRDPWTGGALVSTVHVENFWTPKCKLLLLLESTGKFCSYAFSYSIIKVWDPGRQWCVNSYYSEIIGNIIMGLEISDISLKKCVNADQVEGSEFSWFGLHSPTYALTWVTAEPLMSSSPIADPVVTSNQMLGSPHFFYNTLGYSIHFVVAQDLNSCCSTIEQRHTRANDEQRASQPSLFIRHIRECIASKYVVHVVDKLCVKKVKQDSSIVELSNGFYVETTQYPRVRESTTTYHHIVSYNICIHGLCKNDNMEEALILKEEIRLNGIMSRTVAYRMCILLKLAKCDDVEWKLTNISNKGRVPKEVLYNTIFDGHYSTENILMALKVTKERILRCLRQIDGLLITLHGLLLWEFASGKFALIQSFRFPLTASRRGQARSCQYVGQVRMALKLITLLMFESHKGHGLAWFAKGALDPIFSFRHNQCLSIDIVGWELVSILALHLNLEDKVLIEDGSIVMNQSQPSKDINTQITIGLRRAIGPRTSNMARLIWDPG